LESRRTIRMNRNALMNNPRKLCVISVSEKAGRTEGRKDGRAGRTDRAVSDTT
jgi:hypothetical protein